MIVADAFRGQTVAVFGLARTGLAAIRALGAGGARVLAWDDSPETRALAEAEGVLLHDLAKADWNRIAALILSPGVPLYGPKQHWSVAAAEAAGVPVLGDVELFARAIAAVPAASRPLVVGVTGTNGKSTTSALIHHILVAAGKQAVLGGNIGVGVLSLPAPKAGLIYVLELSSYQLDLTTSLHCNVAVHLNLSPDHLERHGTMERYAQAKRRIFANQTAMDWAVIGVDDGWGRSLCTRLTAQGARCVAPISAGMALSRGVYGIGGQVFDGLGARQGGVIRLSEAPALPGAHNAQNIAAAYAACRGLGLTAEQIAAGVRSFPGLAHRLERAGEVAGVRFINDSKATNADAAAQALAAFPRVYWIAGGRAKSDGIDALAPLFGRVARAYLIGEAAARFSETLGDTPHVIAGDLAAAVAGAYRDARASGEADPIVLFSPACASFDQFRDFEARGDAFKAAVAALSAEAEAHA